MKKVMITFLLFPLIFSSLSYAYGSDTQNSGQRALEERPLNPRPLKCNDPVTGSDGSDPDTEVNLDQ